MNIVEQHLRKLEEDLLQPEFRHNAAALSSVLADEFREFGSSGRILSKRQVIEALQVETSRRFSITNFRVSILAADVALVTYQATQRHGSQQQVSVSLRSSLWVMREDRWQLLFHQGTKMAVS